MILIWNEILFVQLNAVVIFSAFVLAFCLEKYTVLLTTYIVYDCPPPVRTPGSPNPIPGILALDTQVTSASRSKFPVVLSKVEAVRR